MLKHCYILDIDRQLYSYGYEYFNLCVHKIILSMTEGHISIEEPPDIWQRQGRSVFDIHYA